MESFIPDLQAPYIAGCVEEVGKDTYGRENRVPIHDAIRGIANAYILIGQYFNDLGLCVRDGKLNVIYNA